MSGLLFFAPASVNVVRSSGVMVICFDVVPAASPGVGRCSDPVPPIVGVHTKTSPADVTPIASSNSFSVRAMRTAYAPRNSARTAQDDLTT